MIQSCKIAQGVWLFEIVYLIPIFNIESEIDVKVLMMVVVEDAMRLPWLPPVGLEIDSGMVDDSVVVGVEQEDNYGDYKMNRNVSIEFFRWNKKKKSSYSSEWGRGTWAR